MEKLFAFYAQLDAEAFGARLVAGANDYREGAARQLRMFIAWLTAERRELPRAVAEFELEANVRIANGEPPDVALKLRRPDGGRMKDAEPLDMKTLRRALVVLKAHVAQALPLSASAERNAFQHGDAGPEAMRKAWQEHAPWLGKLDAAAALRLVDDVEQAQKRVMPSG